MARSVNAPSSGFAASAASAGSTPNMQPPVPPSGVVYQNPYDSVPQTVVVSGGTGTNVAINSVLQGTFDGTYTVPASGTIALTYTVAPSWTWVSQARVTLALNADGSHGQRTGHGG